MPVLDVEKLIENRVRAIALYHKETGLPRAQLDVSGGVDSAVMLGLLVRAVGADNITAVYSDVYSSDASEERAEEVAKKFGVTLAVLDVNVDFDNLVELCMLGAWDIAATGEEEPSKSSVLKKEVTARMKSDPTILGSFRSCIRAPIGRFMNRLMGGGIRHGTGNECEDRWLRFYQKGGDGEVDTNPLAMLSKGEVYQLAIGLGVPTSILKVVPSPDLQGVGEEGHNDEDELKALTGVDWTYSQIYLEDGLHHKRGDYATVGTIERMSRYMDKVNWPRLTNAYGFSLGRDYVKAAKEELFPEKTLAEVKVYLLSATKLEKQTRHKWNPNCPTLCERGRDGLIVEGILTNTLPKTSLMYCRNQKQNLS